MESLRDKVVVVTGSSSGIGAACAVSCAKYGARVVICGRNKARMVEVSEACAAAGGRGQEAVHCVEGDLTDETSMRKIIDTTIGSAGYGISKGTETVTVEDERALWNLHIVVLFTLVKLSLPHLKRTQGSVLVISSLLGCTPMRGNLPYSVTKAAQNEFVRQLSIELHADTGVRFNAIQPGWVRTPVLEHSGLVGAKYFGEWIFKWLDRLHPIGRCGTAEEIGEYAAFLASDAASSVTGQILAIDGGGTLPHLLQPRLGLV